MRKFFYAQLAAQNIGKNRRFYFPYLLTGLLTAAMFYNILFLQTNPDIAKMPGGDSLQMILSFGAVVVGLFSLIFLYYTNSFLMKRRQKELGLYNILGMGKRHIARVLLWETVYTCLIIIAGGVLTGILLSKLLLLALLRTLAFNVQFGFRISVTAIGITALLFAGIYFAALLSNLLRLRLAKPVELLHGSNVGEKEPKTKAVMAILGIACLTAGYLIANLNDSPLNALPLFFLAVVLVIIGTYFLFTAGSIALLKLLRKNKRYYYQTRHFTAVSGMLYRMKQNAVGLGNICILCTMVLVMVSTTVSLYIGTDDALKLRYPEDVSLEFYTTSDSEHDKEAMQSEIRETVETVVKKNGLTLADSSDIMSLSAAAMIGADGTILLTNSDTYDASIGQIGIITAAEYNRVTGENCTLGADELLYYSVNKPRNWSAMTVGGHSFQAKPIDHFPVGEEYAAYLMDVIYIVVPDQAMFAELANQAGKMPSWTLSFNLSGTDADKIICYNEITEAVQGPDDPYRLMGGGGCRQAASSSFYALYGGLLFLGLFLGLLFLMATVLIIYYKQISEGYDDQSRFEIMRKVGMSSAEVRHAIRSQVLIVFFLPLAMALVHLLAAFHMISQLLRLMNLTNLGLFALCTAGTLAVFAAVYAVVYALTSRTYYTIVSASGNSTK